MPAVSKAQQQAAAIALHHPSKSKTGMAASMSKEELRKFAETPRKGLPKHKEEESLVRDRAEQLVDELLS